MRESPNGSDERGRDGESDREIEENGKEDLRREEKQTQDGMVKFLGFCLDLLSLGAVSRFPGHSLGSVYHTERHATCSCHTPPHPTPCHPQPRRAIRQYGPSSKPSSV